MASRTLDGGTVPAFNSGVIDTVTSAVNVEGLVRLTAFIKQASGNMAGAILICQCSPDGVADNFYDTTFETAVLTDDAQVAIPVSNFSADFIRLKVKTASSIASTCALALQGN